MSQRRISCMAFDRWQQQLLEVLVAVHTKRHHYDKAIDACQLLLKPWPRKSQVNDGDVKRKPEDNAETGNQANPRESADLKLVNELLTKAQKTRVRTSAKDKKQKEDTNTADKGPATGGSDMLQQENCSLDQDGEPNKNTPTAVHEVERCDSRGQYDGEGDTKSQNSVGKVHKSRQHTVPAIKESSERSCLQGSRPANKTRQSSARRKTPVPAADIKRPQSFEKARHLHSNVQPRSGLGKIKPAHSTAPFKTEPNLHFPKRPLKKTVHAVTHQNPGRDHMRSDESRQKNILPPIASCKSQSSSVPSVQSEDNVTGVCESSILSSEESSPSVGVGAESVLQGESLAPEVTALTLSDHVESCAGKVDCRQTHLVQGSAGASEEKQEPKMFSLLTDGSGINIPAKVRRAFAKNQQMRKKVLQQGTQRKSKPGGSNLGQHFADKLQQLFDTEEELLYRQKASECLHIHQRLTELLLQLQLDCVTESSSPSDVLRAKVMVEFVLSSFSAHSEDASLLSKVQFPSTPCVAVPPRIAASHSHVWLPPQVQEQDILLQDGKLQYSSAADLLHYMDLLMQVQLLQCQRCLIQLLTADVLPWLQSFDTNHQDFATVFRGIFSLLTSDGSHSPILVSDNTE